jgi:hypothetical protein
MFERREAEAAVPTTSKRTTRAQSSAADPAATAATLAERRPEDIVDLLNQNKSEFAAAVLLAVPEAKTVAALDQPRLRHGAGIALSDPFFDLAAYPLAVGGNCATIRFCVQQMSHQGGSCAPRSPHVLHASDGRRGLLSEDCPGRRRRCQLLASGHSGGQQPDAETSFVGVSRSRGRLS